MKSKFSLSLLLLSHSHSLFPLIHKLFSIFLCLTFLAPIYKPSYNLFHQFNIQNILKSGLSLDPIPIPIPIHFIWPIQKFITNRISNKKSKICLVFSTSLVKLLHKVLLYVFERYQAFIAFSSSEVYPKFCLRHSLFCYYGSFIFIILF